MHLLNSIFLQEISEISLKKTKPFSSFSDADKVLDSQKTRKYYLND